MNGFIVQEREEVKDDTETTAVSLLGGLFVPKGM